MGNPEDKLAPDALSMELCCPVDPRSPGIMRAFAATLAREQGFPQDQIDQIELAVDEAAANVVRHAYKHLGVSTDLGPNQTPPPDAETRCVVRLRAIVDDDRLVFQVIDSGRGLDDVPCGARDLDEFLARGARGGLGIYIIQNVMDEVHVDAPQGAGTILTMTKFLRPGSRTEPAPARG